MVEPWWRSKTLPNGGHGGCLVVCDRCDPSQFSETRRNATKIATCLPGIGQKKSSNNNWNNNLRQCCRPQASLMTRQKLHETLDHLPYSPDLSLTDCDFFKHLDNFSREKCFKNHDDAENTFNDFMFFRIPEYYATGINLCTYFCTNLIITKATETIDL